ncbi:MAG: glycoside hydrolase family 36 N-terminal domain-containing protein [Ruminococcus sp.]
MYQMQADAYGSCGISGTMQRLAVICPICRTTRRGFSGNHLMPGNDRTYSLDTLPLEYAGAGVGDFRVPAVAAVHADGSSALDLRYYSHMVNRKVCH